MQKETFEVANEYEGERLDKYVSILFPEQSRSFFQKIIKYKAKSAKPQILFCTLALFYQCNYSLKICLIFRARKCDPHAIIQWKEFIWVELMLSCPGSIGGIKVFQQIASLFLDDPGMDPAYCRRWNPAIHAFLPFTDQEAGPFHLKIRVVRIFTFQ